MGCTMSFRLSPSSGRTSQLFLSDVLLLRENSMVGQNRQSMVRPIQFGIVRQHYDSNGAGGSDLEVPRNIRFSGLPAPAWTGLEKTAYDAHCWEPPGKNETIHDVFPAVVLASRAPWIYRVPCLHRAGGLQRVRSRIRDPGHQRYTSAGIRIHVGCGARWSQ